MSQRVGIFYFRGNLGGGSTTFTVHLYKALQAAGAEPTVYRVRPTSSKGKRKTFGGYDGVGYMRISKEDAVEIVRNMPTVMAAPAHSKELTFAPNIISSLMKIGMRVVVHDPNEFKVYDHLKSKPPTRVICIRPTMLKFYPDALWIQHPFSTVSVDVPRKKLAGSTARIASVKRPRMLLEANRLVSTKRRVELRGAEHRLYTYNLQKKFGDVFKQCGKTFQFPLTLEDPVKVAAEYELNFDMTYFPDDGGGTQYAQMEAMNAGTVNVMHEDWFRHGAGEMVPGRHVLTVSSVDDIVKMLRKPPSEQRRLEIAHNGALLLKRHAPKRIGKIYMEELLT